MTDAGRALDGAAEVRPVRGGAGAVVLDRLGRSYGEIQAVSDLSLEIGAGETFGLLGPNGAGKTSTLEMLATLRRPTRGDALVLGSSLVREPQAVRRKVGLAPQELAVYEGLTGLENLVFFAGLYGVSRAEARRRARGLLARLGLESRARDRVATYSGGMKRRLNLACALVHEPDVLLLDEPTVGVDPQSREHLLTDVETIAREGTTVIYTTHYMEEAERLCDRIAILDGGRLVALGTRDELLERVGMGEVIEWKGAAPAPERLAALPGYKGAEAEGALRRVFVERAAAAMAPLLALLTDTGTEPQALRVYPVDLGRVFLQLTGQALRD